MVTGADLLQQLLLGHREHYVAGCAVEVKLFEHTLPDHFIHSPTAQNNQNYLRNNSKVKTITHQQK